MFIMTEPQKETEEKPAERRMEDLDLTPGELALIQVKFYKNADMFTEALMAAITYADADDLIKLRQVYPEHVEAYRNYKIVPGWYDNLVSRLPQRRQSDN